MLRRKRELIPEMDGKLIGGKVWIESESMCRCLEAQGYNMTRVRLNIAMFGQQAAARRRESEELQAAISREAVSTTKETRP